MSRQNIHQRDQIEDNNCAVCMPCVCRVLGDNASSQIFCSVVQCIIPKRGSGKVHEQEVGAQKQRKNCHQSRNDDADIWKRQDQPQKNWPDCVRSDGFTEQREGDHFGDLGGNRGWNGTPWTSREAKGYQREAGGFFCWADRADANISKFFYNL